MKLTDRFDLDRDEWVALIDRWIFDETTREMLKRRLLDGKTLEQLSEEFNYSVTSVKKKIYKAEDKLFRHMN